MKSNQEDLLEKLRRDEVTIRLAKKLAAAYTSFMARVSLKMIIPIPWVITGLFLPIKLLKIMYANVNNLPSYLRPDGRLSYVSAYELTVFLHSPFPFPAELTQYPVRRHCRTA